MTKKEFQNIKGGEICRLTIERYCDEVVRVVKKDDTTLTVTNGKSNMIVHWTELELMDYDVQVGDVVRSKRFMENFVYSTNETVIFVSDTWFQTNKDIYTMKGGINKNANRIVMEIVSRKTK